MRVAFVQTYPIYHDMVDTETWLQRRDRVRWVPGLTAAMGHEVELWAADRTASTHLSTIEGVGDYTIRFFDSVESRSQTKKHYSNTLVDHARDFNADIHLLKGVDGGVGLHLLDDYLLPNGKDFAFVIGGKYYTRHVPKARFVFYETEAQRQNLRDPGWRFWRSPVPDERLLRMPKAIDTDQFRPMPDVEPEWDVISVGRLIHRYKNYDALGALSNRFRVAVVGDGPAKEDLASTYPNVDWIGSVPHPEIPQMLNRARVFMHAGMNDYFPRVIAEAAACGLPVLGFADAIAPDVIPPGCGIRLNTDDFIAEIEALFRDDDRIDMMGNLARSYADDRLGKFSSREPIRIMLDTLESVGS